MTLRSSEAEPVRRCMVVGFDDVAVLKANAERCLAAFVAHERALIQQRHRILPIVAVEQAGRAIPDLVGLRLLCGGDPGGRRRGGNRITGRRLRTAVDIGLTLVIDSDLPEAASRSLVADHYVDSVY